MSIVYVVDLSPEISYEDQDLSLVVVQPTLTTLYKSPPAFQNGTHKAVKEGAANIHISRPCLGRWSVEF